ncbi:peptidase E-like [Oppia nitens]|uniref:peptidase E-like n=1 Tax=Oppia nitens TaxID=1686743 RepID=UPI0023DCBFEC|nr:peptidase E-like [Oppia nitens]
MSVSRRLLLLSNSTMSDKPYMEWSKDLIYQFLGSNVKNVVFIPFAGVSIDWDKYEDKVKTALNKLNITSIHKTRNYLESIATSDAIMIGGGNTFHLLHQLQHFNLIDAIRKRVIDDGIPYIGWSAGSNVATPDIGTTNDMPIIWPQTESALNLVNYNINPHYNEWKPEGHQGESRSDRLNECIVVKKRPIVAISEGLAIRVEGDQHIVVAPDLNIPNNKRMVKIWKHNKAANGDNIQVIDISYGQDIAPIVNN